MNLHVVHWLNALTARHDGLEDPLTFYETVSEVLFAALVVFVFLFGGRRGARGAVAALAAAAVALAAGQVVAALVPETRPFVAHPRLVHALISHGSDSSFPSDHATAAFAIATAIWLRRRYVGVAVLVLATLLAIGRVAVGVHYPGDVVAGAALGVAAALLLWTPPLRRLTDAVADRVHAVWTAAVARMPLARGA